MVTQANASSKRSSARTSALAAARRARSYTAGATRSSRVHLHRLEELEYLLVHRGGRGQSFVYELVFERQPDSGKPMLPGLIEAEKLAAHAMTQRSLALEGEKSGPSLPQVREVSGGGAGEKSPVLTRRNGDLRPESRKNHYTGHKRKSRRTRSQRGPDDGAHHAGSANPIRHRRRRSLRSCTSTLNALRVRDYSEHTVKNRHVHIGFFLAWCKERGLSEPTEITRPVLERYQRYLFHYRKKNGEPLSFRSQHTRLVPLRVWFKWMTRQNHILHNPASEIELPRLGHRLPKHVLSASEVEQVMMQPRSRRSVRTARPRHPGDALLDGDAAAGNHAT